MAIYKEVLNSDIKSARSYLNQLIDVIQEDISSSLSRRKYQHFVTGGLGPGVTSSLYQTVYDQDFTFQTANPIFDVTVGLRPGGTTVTSVQTSIDSSGKELFPSTTMMMREKMDVYRQFAQVLLGNASSSFVFPYNSTTANDTVDCALFVSYKRLFSRDSIKDKTYVTQFYYDAQNPAGTTNLDKTSTSTPKLYTDYNSSGLKLVDVGGTHANIIDSTNSANVVGQIYYERGIAVYNLNKIINNTTYKVSGTIKSASASGTSVIGSSSGNPNAKFIPDLMTSGSIDDIVDHICSCRFQSGSLTATTFQNVTNINSTLVFCRAGADEFNYSQNPTYVGSNNRMVVITPGNETTERSFTFITTIGLYDINDNLLAVSKLSRPIEKNGETDLTFRMRLDF